MEPDFGGYATKAGLRCSDGRVIKAEAFQHMDGKTVPLVWQHGHSNAENVLGRAVLESRPDGVYAYGFFNGTKQGENAKQLVQHRDLDSLSIYANQLKEQNKVVSHGSIREVSLVLSGANPGAKIDQVRIAHSDDPDDVTELDDEAVISHMGVVELIEDESDEEEEEDVAVEHADGETVQDIYNSLTDMQKDVVHYMIGAALEQNDSGSAEHADDEEGIAHQEGTDDVPRNVFEQNNNTGGQTEVHALSHDAMNGLLADAGKRGSLKEAVEAYALSHGIDNIEILFPDARTINSIPELNKRRTEWVANVLNGTHHTPFSRLKTITADITQDDARAKGYIKGNYKLEEWFGVTKRTTTPTTIYKKQKLDRDDMLDITDFDVVAFLKAEMRVMLEEELARAILIGDGRDVASQDKIKDPLGASDGAGIRSIVNDHELFVTTLLVNVSDANSTYDEVVDAVMDGMEFYKGTGTPTLYTTTRELNKFLKAKDTQGRRLYANKAEVADALGVAAIVIVEPMNEVTDLVGIVVNLDDYNIGADAGGEVSLFDDFDIDYNQQKYLMETRLSGALTKIKSALVIRKTAAANVLTEPVKPAFVPATGVITIPTVTGIDYKDSGGATLTAGAQTALAAGQTKTIYAVAKANFYLANNQTDSWQYKRPSA